jgi:hypothetical protein
LLTDADIAGMRSAVEDSLPDTAVIQTRTFVGDSGGGGTSVWAASGTVACRVSPRRPSNFGAERDVAMRITEVATFLVTLPQSASCDTNSRIQTMGNTYEVVGLQEPRSWDLCRRVEVLEVV